MRLKNNPELSFLEKNLFRYKTATYEGKVENISIFEASSPSEEIRQTMIKISRLVKDKGYAYRDIALVCGSMETASAGKPANAASLAAPTVPLTYVARPML